MNPPSRRRDCSGKQRHVSFGRAEAALRSLMRRGMDVSRMHTYVCPWCRHIHVGHRALSQWERRHGANAL